MPTEYCTAEYTPEDRRAQFNPGCSYPGCVDGPVAGRVAVLLAELVAGRDLAPRGACPDSARFWRRRAPNG